MRETVHAHDIIDIADANPDLLLARTLVPIRQKVCCRLMLTSAAIFVVHTTCEFTGEINAIIRALTACWIVQRSAGRHPW
jgi:hypothetical protein